MATSEHKFTTSGRTVAPQPKGPVRLRFLEGENGSASVEMSVDYERAEVPDRRYYADYCKVVSARSGLSFAFGRLVPGETTLRTQVEISFPDTLFVRQLWRSSREFQETLERQCAGKNLVPVSEVSGTDKVQGFRANNVFMATFGDDAIMDFYYIAPADVHFVRIGRRSDAYLEPVIRIALPTTVMLEFFEQCEPHAERLLHHATEEIDEP